jgi:hypothetical protein
MVDNSLSVTSLIGGVFNAEQVVSVVSTNISEFIAINHRHPTFNGTNDMLNYYFENSKSITCLSIKSEKTTTHSLAEILLSNSEFHVDADVSPYGIIDGTYKIPSGTIGELLDESTIAALANDLRLKDMDSLKHATADSAFSIDSCPSVEDYQKHFAEIIPKIIINQLVRNSAPNHLNIVNESFPCFVEFNKDWGIVVDSSYRSNCGYSPANAFIYKILDKGKLQQQNLFPYYNLVLSGPKLAKFKFLSNYECSLLNNNSEKVNKSIPMIKIMYNNQPAIIYYDS